MYQFIETLKITLVLFALILPSYALRKSKMISKASVSGLVVILLYACQPFLTIRAFVINPVSPALEIAENMGWVFLFAVIGQIVIFFAARLVFFRKKHDDADKAKDRIYIYASVFSNAGFIGIPFVAMLTRNDPYALIYATVYNVVFQMLIWTLGVYIITGDIKAIRPLKAFLNPAIIPLIIALPMFFWPPSNIFAMEALKPLDKIVTYFADMCAPLSMIIVGIRMADVPLKDIFKGSNTYLSSGMKLIIAPALMFLLLLPLSYTALFAGEAAKYVLKVPVIMMAMPPAATMIAMSERYNGDTDTALKVFVCCTLLSIITMPFIVLLSI